MRPIHLIGVPLDLGGGRRGVDMGPSAFRVADIHRKLRELGYDVTDAGDLPVHVAETREPGDPRLKYLAEIRGICEKLRDTVFTIPFDLDFNASYHWSVTATVATGEQAVARVANSRAELA